jgi:tetratricopeptide (TPR) repeat protein
MSLRLLNSLGLPLFVALAVSAQDLREDNDKLDPVCGEYRLQVQDYIDARDLQQAESMLRPMLVEGSPFQAGSCFGEVLSDMATVMLLSGRLAEAEAFGRRSVAALENAYPRHSPDLLNPLGTLALAYLKQAKISKAREVVNRMQSISSPGPRQRALVHALTASLRNAEGKLREAEAEAMATLRLYDEIGVSNTGTFASMLVSLSAIYVRQHRPAEAEQALLRGIAILEIVADAAPLDWIRVLQTRAILHEKQSRWNEAARDLQQALLLVDREPQAEPLTVQMLLANYAFVLRKMHRKQDARKIETQASAFRRDHPELEYVVDANSLINGRTAGVK